MELYNNAHDSITCSSVCGQWRPRDVQHQPRRLHSHSSWWYPTDAQYAGCTNQPRYCWKKVDGVHCEATHFRITDINTCVQAEGMRNWQRDSHPAQMPYQRKQLIYLRRIPHSICKVFIHGIFPHLGLTYIPTQVHPSYLSIDKKTRYTANRYTT